MKIKRSVLFLLSVLICSFLLGACNTTESPVDPVSPVSEEQNSDEKETIYFVNYAVLETTYTEFWNKVKVDFEVAYPQYTLEYLTVPYNEVLSFTTNRVGGGDRVDLIFGEISWVGQLASSGIIDPIDKVMDPKLIEDFKPDVLASYDYEGKHYGAPLYYSPSVLFFNKDLLTAAGLDPADPPETYDEMLQYAELLSDLKTTDGQPVFAFGLPYGAGMAAGYNINSVILSHGGQLLDDQGKLSIDNQGFLDAINLYRTLDDEGYNPQNTLPKNLRQMFATSQLAMYYDQAGAYAAIHNINNAAESFTGIAPALGTDAPDTGQTLLHAHSFLVSYNDETTAAATRDFINFFMTEDVLGWYLKNLFPSWPSLKSMESMELLPIVKNIDADDLNIGQQINTTQSGALQLELTNLVQSVTLSDNEVDEAIGEFRKQAEIILSN